MGSGVVRCVVLIVCLAIARGRRALQRIDIRAVSNKLSSIKCNPAGHRMAISLIADHMDVRSSRE